MGLGLDQEEGVLPLDACTFHIPAIQGMHSRMCNSNIASAPPKMEKGRVHTWEVVGALKRQKMKKREGPKEVVGQKEEGQKEVEEVEQKEELEQDRHREEMKFHLVLAPLAWEVQGNEEHAMRHLKTEPLEIGRAHV